MNRRRFLATTASATLPLVAGCLSDPGANGGLLEVLETSEPPAATVVTSSDDRIRNVQAVQAGLGRAASARRSVAEVEVTEEEFGTVARALSALPWYDRTEHDAGHISGCYIRFAGDDRVYVVVLTPFCADSWFRDAESERGEYGWGGCYDRAEWSY